MKRYLVSIYFVLSISVLAQQSSREGFVDQSDWARQLIKLCDDKVYDEPVTALSYSKEALSIAKILDSTRLEAVSLNRIGIAYWSRGDLGEALIALNSSMELALRIGEVDLAAKNFGNLGSLYAEANLNLTAIQLYKEALKGFEERELVDRILVTNNNMAKSFLAINELDSAEIYLDRALSIRSSDPDRYDMYYSILLVKLSEIELKRGNTRAADSVLSIALRTAEERKEQRGISRASQLKAEILFLDGEGEEALEYAMKAFEIAKKSKSRIMLHRASQTLSKVYAARGAFDESYTFLTLSNKYKDSLQNVAVRRQLLLQKPQLINAKHKEKGMIEKLEETDTIYFNLFIVSILVALITVVWSIYNRRKLKTEGAISSAAEKVDHRNIGDELVINKLRSTVAMMYSTATVAEREPQLAMQENMFYPLRQKAKSVLEVLDSMALKTKEEDGSKERFRVIDLIEEVVNERAEDFTDKGLEIETEITDDEFVYTNLEILRVILRCLLSNAVRYSTAGSEISIYSLVVDGKYKLVVMDQGTGMSEEQLALLFTENQICTEGTEGEPGLGVSLILCQQLALKVDAKIEAKSAEGQGTSVAVSLPCD